MGALITRLGLWAPLGHLNNQTKLLGPLAVNIMTLIIGIWPFKGDFQGYYKGFRDIGASITRVWFWVLGPFIV